VLFLGAPAPPAQESADAEPRGPAVRARHEDVAAAVATGLADAGRLSTADLAMALWCAVHGLATLTITAPADALAGETTLAALDEAILGPDPRWAPAAPVPR
jgi:hypothetical protein